MSGFWHWKGHHWRWPALWVGGISGAQGVEFVVAAFGVDKSQLAPQPSQVSDVWLRGGSGMPLCSGSLQKVKGHFWVQNSPTFRFLLSREKSPSLQPVVVDGGDRDWVCRLLCTSATMHSICFLKKEAIFNGNRCLITNSALLVFSGRCSEM